MASTYTLISSQTLASSAASVTFSSIPTTYTDLVLKVSARSDGSVVVQDSLWLTFNGASLGYSTTELRGNGSSASSSYSSNSTYLRGTNAATANGAITNSFGSAEIYIPSYTATQSKPVSVFGVAETNATSAGMGATAGLSNITVAITTIAIAMSSGSNWLTNSSFYLYGISSS